MLLHRVAPLLVLLPWAACTAPNPEYVPTFIDGGIDLAVPRDLTGSDRPVDLTVADLAAVDLAAPDPPPPVDLAMPDLVMPASCLNNLRDGDETDVDCGGVKCPRCASGKMCKIAIDCV